MTYVDLNTFELVGGRVELKLNPHSAYNKTLKFLRKSNGEVSSFAKLEGDIHPIKCGYDGESRFFILPQGGPKLIVGENLPVRLGYNIKDILYFPSNEDEKDYYILELEEVDDTLSEFPEESVSDTWSEDDILPGSN